MQYLLGRAGDPDERRGSAVERGYERPVNQRALMSQGFEHNDVGTYSVAGGKRSCCHCGIQRDGIGGLVWIRM